MASVEETAPPLQTIFTAEVRLEGVHGIGQDSPWVLGHTVGRRLVRNFCIAKLGIETTAATIGLRRAPPNAPKHAKSALVLVYADNRNMPKKSVSSPHAHKTTYMLINLVYAGLAIAAVTVFSERAAGEQQSIFHTAAAHLRGTKI